MIDNAGTLTGMSDEEFTVSRHDWELLLQRVAKLEQAQAQVEHTKEVAVADDGKQVAKAKRGHRLPEGWIPDQHTIDIMVAELHVPSAVLASEHRKFCDYFYSVPGQRGVKLDWDRTWRNWMRTASERGSLWVLRDGQYHRTNDRTNADKAQEWRQMGERYAEGE